jgi:hypothetical protein
VIVTVREIVAEFDTSVTSGEWCGDFFCPGVRYTLSVGKVRRLLALTLSAKNSWEWTEAHAEARYLPGCHGINPDVANRFRAWLKRKTA